MMLFLDVHKIFFNDTSGLTQYILLSTRVSLSG